MTSPLTSTPERDDCTAALEQINETFALGTSHLSAFADQLFEIARETSQPNQPHR